jgi:hypothetical protein
MTGVRQLAWGLLLIPACFHPSYDHPACGPNGACPSGWTCNVQLICDKAGSAADASLPDVPTTIDGGPGTDASPGTVCYGPAGWQACFDAAPTGNVMLLGAINTDGGAPCLGMSPMGWAAPQPIACFIVGDTITVPGGGTVVTGSKPRVLVANRLIAVTGVLDVASKRGDIGPPPSECQPFSTAPNVPDTGVGGGGGAGGSFITRAGDGGNGDGGAQNGQASQADIMAPTHLRRGCPGQAGGALAAGDAGTLGLGGGSVYLVSGGEIAIVGAINASGAGGQGGNKRAGGSGGGSGGMIVLYSAKLTVSLAPVLMANGGGGGGGSPGNQAPDGSDPSVTSPLVPTPAGGNGGQGYPATLNALDGTGGASGGGSGGGGGGGGGYIRSNQPLTGATVSPPVSIAP